MTELNLYALVDKKGSLIIWESRVDGERGPEIHLTRREARAARMAGERVVKVKLVLQ